MGWDAAHARSADTTRHDTTRRDQTGGARRRTGLAKCEVITHTLTRRHTRTHESSPYGAVDDIQSSMFLSSCRMMASATRPVWCCAGVAAGRSQQSGRRAHTKLIISHLLCLLVSWFDMRRNAAPSTRVAL